MFVRMGRNGIACRSELHMISALDDNLIAGLHTGENLYLASVVSSQLHLLLLIAFGIHLQVDEMDALLLGDGTLGQRDDILHLSGQEVNLDKRTGNDVAQM